jgi:rare lipoprotein A (peptidoglycan hydrolase)
MVNSLRFSVLLPALAAVSACSGLSDRERVLETSGSQSAAWVDENESDEDDSAGRVDDVAEPGLIQAGLASWYGPYFDHKRTANGELFDMNKLSAAHRTLPLNSEVRVTNLMNDRWVVVRVNDRGPYVADRIIDLSAEAARRLGFKEAGVAPVMVQLVDSERGDRD